MPRTGKGGKREGAAQTAYSNRTDLNNRGPQPITVAPGQAYGEAKMQEDAQKAVPMGGTPVPEATKQWLWGFLCGVVASTIVVLFFILVGCTTPTDWNGIDKVIQRTGN